MTICDSEQMKQGWGLAEIMVGLITNMSEVRRREVITQYRRLSVTCHMIAFVLIGFVIFLFPHI